MKGCEFVLRRKRPLLCLPDKKAREKRRQKSEWNRSIQIHFQILMRLPAPARVCVCGFSQWQPLDPKRRRNVTPQKTSFPHDQLPWVAAMFTAKVQGESRCGANSKAKPVHHGQVHHHHRVVWASLAWAGPVSLNGHRRLRFTRRSRFIFSSIRLRSNAYLRTENHERLSPSRRAQGFVGVLMAIIYMAALASFRFTVATMKQTILLLRFWLRRMTFSFSQTRRKYR